jgi:hypothetical protein
MRDYLAAKIVFGASTIVTFADAIKFGTGVLAGIGAFFMAISAIYHFQGKRMDNENKKLQRELLEIEIKTAKSKE